MVAERCMTKVIWWMSCQRGEGCCDEEDECVPWGGQTVEWKGIAWSDETVMF